eukprot:m.79589 g.79589  ORF g.79589 m.79589 type:complete len:68 (-) comp14520_c0_seq2:50-253(-)
MMEVPNGSSEPAAKRPLLSVAPDSSESLPDANAYADASVTQTDQPLTTSGSAPPVSNTSKCSFIQNS